jgi:hypothetical protein
MSLRSSRFYLFGYLHYYGHIRLPRLWWTDHNVRASHVHALPLSCTQHHLTPGICWNANCHYFFQHCRFHHLWKIDRYHLVSRSLTDAAYKTVTSELRKARFRAGYLLRQMYFNLNGKLGCKALSSLKVFIYIYARLVAHQRITKVNTKSHKGKTH